jgi:hypothetical protein
MRSKTFCGIDNLPLEKALIITSRFRETAIRHWYPIPPGLGPVTVSGHHPTPIQASQIVFPRFIRYENSPVLTPIMKKTVKIMMSHKTVLGIQASHYPLTLLKRSMLPFDFNYHYTQGQSLWGNFFKFLDNYNNIIIYEYYEWRIYKYEGTVGKGGPVSKSAGSPHPPDDHPSPGKWGIVGAGIGKSRGHQPIQRVAASQFAEGQGNPGVPAGGPAGFLPPA